ncbi:MAG: hypothetical protein ACK4IY_03235, partial [Chitinophagales bacterium]
MNGVVSINHVDLILHVALNKYKKALGVFILLLYALPMTAQHQQNDFSQHYLTPLSEATGNLSSALSQSIESVLHYYDGLIYFTENKGQWSGDLLYKADFPYGKAIAKANGMWISVYNESDVRTAWEWGIAQEEADQNGMEYPYPKGVIRAHGWQMQFIGASQDMYLETRKPHPDVMHFFTGEGSATDVRSFQEVWYRNVYAHVDVRYYPSNEGALEYDIICKPGFNPEQIVLKMDGISSIQKQADGSLVFETSVGFMQVPAPYIYQKIDDKILKIEGAFIVRNNNEVSFQLGEYNPNVPVLIDPIALRWATWVNTSSTGDNHGHCIWVDPLDGSIYMVARVSGSTNYITIGAYDITANGNIDLIVGKYN